MPSIDIAMASSLREGPLQQLRDSFVRNVATPVARRDLVQDTTNKVTDIKTALSSWDNCMAASFCKWPAIAIMVVGGLIILSIIACIVRCACCAKSCCCSCFACFKCCGNCCGCCDAPGERKKNKYLDEPYVPAQQGYRTEAPMHAFPPATVGVTPPQYAEFETKKRGEDALPQMPSWEGANSKKIELEEEEHEMNDLKKPPTEPKSPLAGVDVSPIPGPGRNGQMARDNLNGPYGQGHPQLPNMMPAPSSTPHRDPYAPTNPYDSHQDGFGLDPPYDLPPAGMAPTPNGRNSPGPGRHGYGPGPGHDLRSTPHEMGPGYADMPAGPAEFEDRDPFHHGPAPGSMGAAAAGYARRQGPSVDPYGSNPRMGSPGPGRGPGSPGPGYRGLPGPNRTGNNSPAPYGMDPRMRNSPGPGQGPRASPRPHADPYGRPPRQTPAPINTNYGPPAQGPLRENFDRSYSPGPDRQYAQSPRPMHAPSRLGNREEPPTSPIVNNSGFDFNSGFARPQTADSSHYDQRPSEPAEPQQQYPGYKAYRPT